MLVASQDTKSPLATLAMVVSAGARHETAATAGAAAYLNAAAFQVGILDARHVRRLKAVRLQSSGDYSAFATTREAEVIGANFHVVADRDFTAYVVTVPRINAEKAAHILASASTSEPKLL